METIEKEKYITQISSGILIFNYKGKDYYIKPPSLLLKQESFNYYSQILESIQFETFITNEDINNILVKNGIIEPNTDSIIESINKDIDLYKIEAFNNWMNKKRVDMIKTSINSMEKRLLSIMSAKHSMDHLTKEGYAELCRLNFIVLNSVYNRKGKLLNIEKNAFLSDKILNYYSTSFFPAHILRELARSEPWNSIYSLSNGNPFNNCSINLTENQKNLLMYSKMYENIYKSPDCPNELVINDDILLDGWILVQKQKSKEGDNKKDGNKTGELFILAENREHAQQISKLNTVESRTIIRNREKMIKEKGVVNEVEFPDVQMALRQQAMKG